MATGAHGDHGAVVQEIADTAKYIDIVRVTIRDQNLEGPPAMVLLLIQAHVMIDTALSTEIGVTGVVSNNVQKNAEEEFRLDIEHVVILIVHTVVTHVMDRRQIPDRVIPSHVQLMEIGVNGLSMESARKIVEMENQNVPECAMIQLLNMVARNA